jgi:hypothetical protein
MLWELKNLLASLSPRATRGRPHKPYPSATKSPSSPAPPPEEAAGRSPRGQRRRQGVSSQLPGSLGGWPRWESAIRCPRFGSPLAAAEPAGSSGGGRAWRVAAGLGERWRVVEVGGAVAEQDALVVSVGQSVELGGAGGWCVGRSCCGGARAWMDCSPAARAHEGLIWACGPDLGPSWATGRVLRAVSVGWSISWRALPG